MKNQKKAFAATLLLGAAGLVFMAGCKLPFGDDAKQHGMDQVTASHQGEPLVKIDGKTVLTIPEYEAQFEALREANQQLEMFLQMMPNAEREYIFRSIADSKVVKAWAENEGIDKTPEFKKQQQLAHQEINMNLYMKALDEKHPVEVTDAEVKKYYEEKKDTLPGLMVSPGGVSTSYVRFDSKDKTEKFLDDVKEIKNLEEFKEEAKKEKLTVAEATINNQSSFGDDIKNKVLSIKKFPSAHLVKAGENAYWVLYATEKSKAQYRDINSKEVHDGLKQALMGQKKQESMQQTLEKLKKEMNLEENTEYFDKKEATKRAAMEAMVKEHAQNNSDDNVEAHNHNKAVKV